MHRQTPPTGHHGILRGHAAALDVARSRQAEPWSLETLAEEVHLFARARLLRTLRELAAGLEDIKRVLGFLGRAGSKAPLVGVLALCSPTTA